MDCNNVVANGILRCLEISVSTPSQTFIRGVPTTPDPSTSAKVRRAYFCKNIAIEMAAASRYFQKISGSGVNMTLP